MLITTAHLLALHELAASEAAGQAVRTLAEDDPQEHSYRVLELQGLVLLEAPWSYRLTYAGCEALGILEAMREATLLPPLDQLKNDWRFLGSDTLTALLAAQALSARGLTQSVHDTLEKRFSVRLNRYGEAWADFARRHRPRLEINGDLANSIRHMHSSYTGRPGLDTPPEHIALLEAMDLLTWSVPERTVYALTALGQAVYEALLKEGYAPLDAVLDEPTLEVLALLVDKGSAALTSEQRNNTALDEEKQGWALEKLEARGLIERLVDGQIMRTEAGQLLARAVSDAMHLGHPVTPAIVRLLAAMRQVGTLYVKERKIRIQPEKWAEAERLAGLGLQEFKETVHIARIGHYIGEATITEPGLDLLAAQEQLNSKPEHGVASHHEQGRSSDG